MLLVSFDEIGNKFAENIRAVFVVGLGAGLAVFVYERPVVSWSFMPAFKASTILGLG